MRLDLDQALCVSAAWPYHSTGRAGHFDIYIGDDFERVIADEIEFLRRHVPSNIGPTAPGENLET